MLRNLIEASESELRPHRLPALLADVQRIVADGSLDEINGFNRAQADDQQAKWAFLKAHPDLATVLFRLEDHPLLRGSLQAFDLTIFNCGSYRGRAGSWPGSRRGGQAGTASAGAGS